MLSPNTIKKLELLLVLYTSKYGSATMTNVMTHVGTSGDYHTLKVWIREPARIEKVVMQKANDLYKHLKGMK